MAEGVVQSDESCPIWVFWPLCSRHHTNLKTLGFREGYIIERGLKPLALSGPFPHGAVLHNLLLKQG